MVERFLRVNDIAKKFIMWQKSFINDIKLNSTHKNHVFQMYKSDSITTNLRRISIKTLTGNPVNYIQTLKCLTNFREYLYCMYNCHMMKPKGYYNSKTKLFTLIRITYDACRCRSLIF